MLREIARPVYPPRDASLCWVVACSVRLWCEQITVTARRPERAAEVAQRYGASTTVSNDHAVAAADLCLLCGPTLSHLRFSRWPSRSSVQLLVARPLAPSQPALNLVLNLDDLLSRESITPILDKIGGSIRAALLGQTRPEPGFLDVGRSTLSFAYHCRQVEFIKALSPIHGGCHLLHPGYQSPVLRQSLLIGELHPGLRLGPRGVLHDTLLRPCSVATPSRTTSISFSVILHICLRASEHTGRPR